ncbi:MAG: class I SAM-dependent methyltransferase [Thermoanaerobaculia bacterium]
MTTEPLIRNVSDTARWVAVFRAIESERPDAVFRDPFARRLAGERGEQIAASIPFSGKHLWSWTSRTWLIDQFILREVRHGADLVINLAAGLDARPYRMELPPSLQWVEVDLPEIVSYKEEVLGDEKPVCALERVRLDLSDVDGRRELFARLGARVRKAMIVTEGLLIYLAEAEVASLARDLAAAPSFQRWTMDLASPRLVRALQKKMGKQLDRGNAPLKWGPEEGPEFFVPYGWKPAEVCSLLKTGLRLERLPFWMRLFARLEAPGFSPTRPWSGICLFGRT